MSVKLLAELRPAGNFPVAETSDIQHGNKRLNTVLSDIETVNDSKADKTYVDAQLATKASTTALTEGLATKADNSTVSALTSRVSTNETNIANLSNYVTPQMFGAKGDGVTDDTQALKNCLSSKSNIYLPNGIYLITSTINITRTIHIYGESKDGSIILYNGAGNALSFNSVTYSTLNNFTLKGNSKNNDGIFGKLMYVGLNEMIITKFNNAIIGKQDGNWNGSFTITKSQICDCSYAYSGLNGIMNAIRFQDCFINEISGCVISVHNETKQAFIENMSFIGCEIEGNSGNFLGSGLNEEYICYSFDLTDCYIESTSLLKDNSKILGCIKFNGCHFSGSNGSLINKNKSDDNVTLVFSGCDIHKPIDAGAPIYIGSESGLSITVYASILTFMTNTGATTYNEIINCNNGKLMVYNEHEDTIIHNNVKSDCSSHIDISRVNELSSYKNKNINTAVVSGNRYFFYNKNESEWKETLVMGNKINSTVPANGYLNIGVPDANNSNHFLIIIQKTNGSSLIAFACAQWDSSYAINTIVTNSDLALESVDKNTIKIVNSSNTDIGVYGSITVLSTP